ncbi:hypothetical protein TGAM01_v203598 [Trichoderma gamsii]|uniref:Uncharacterized protein n=1 Tax=Trichoderma gamsii TaxID=398673 RepID=A0A2P4ZU66_9HYPO|nr:hypothetical protein TGAM01_v203598 [Trichoderma gamsii]PON27831.1 hypothetical protein TGAM01_v203598 [Trichoderma gamsii]
MRFPTAIILVIAGTTIASPLPVNQDGKNLVSRVPQRDAQQGYKGYYDKREEELVARAPQRDAQQGYKGYYDKREE